MADKGRAFDELLSFLGDPIFQIPVRTFMDEHSLIFEPSILASGEHHQIHNQYKILIDTLLETFCQDAGISMEEATAGIKKMNDIPDIRGVFEVLFEQVLAANDFQIFFQVMAKRNMMIQEQVLLMIISATGNLPDSMRPARKADGKKSPSTSKPPSSGDRGEPSMPSISASVEDESEEEILKKVMASSSRESKAEHDRLKALSAKEDQDLQKTIALSKQEVDVLQEKRSNLEETQKTGKLLGLSKMTIDTASANTSSKTSVPKTSDVKSGSGSTSLSNEDAASLWLKSAQSEAESSTHKAMAASLSKLSQDELKGRAQFLKQQRDKLLAMKKEAREKQLGEATKSQPQRPQSARAARSAMGGATSKSAMTEEDKKKMDMRKAIAEKLREEVIGGK